MSGKDLFEGMIYVDECFVDEAESRAFPKPRIFSWIKAASIAACLCLILFGLHNLLPYLSQGPTDGQDIEDSMAQSGVGNELQDESQESAIGSPEEYPAQEVPSVILYVEDMTALGFIGTVVQMVDTDIFDIGMELNVVVADGTRHQTADEKPSMSADSTTDYSGSYVMVQFIEYNQETVTIVVNLITEADPQN